MNDLSALQNALQTLANPHKQRTLQRFFKTAQGEYAEGDIFLGITVPEQRRLIKQFQYVALQDIETLLQNNIHEYRFCALLLFIHQYQTGDNHVKKSIFELYIKYSATWINNWDLVDLSAPPIMGDFIYQQDGFEILEQFAQSSTLWQRRIAIVSTLYFIRRDVFQPTLKICEQLLFDRHDLIHKACGWMLREVGKRNESILVDFLEQHCSQMPRTMLRYSIEKFSPSQRKYFLNN